MSVGKSGSPSSSSKLTPVEQGRETSRSVSTEPGQSPRSSVNGAPPSGGPDEPRYSYSASDSRRSADAGDRGFNPDEMPPEPDFGAAPYIVKRFDEERLEERRHEVHLLAQARWPASSASVLPTVAQPAAAQVSAHVQVLADDPAADPIKRDAGNLVQALYRDKKMSPEAHGAKLIVLMNTAKQSITSAVAAGMPLNTALTEFKKAAGTYAQSMKIKELHRVAPGVNWLQRHGADSNRDIISRQLATTIIGLNPLGIHRKRLDTERAAPKTGFAAVNAVLLKPTRAIKAELRKHDPDAKAALEAARDAAARNTLASSFIKPALASANSDHADLATLAKKLNGCLDEIFNAMSFVDAKGEPDIDAFHATVEGFLVMQEHDVLARFAQALCATAERRFLPPEELVLLNRLGSSLHGVLSLLPGCQDVAERLRKTPLASSIAGRRNNLEADVVVPEIKGPTWTPANDAQRLAQASLRAMARLAVAQLQLRAAFGETDTALERALDSARDHVWSLVAQDVPYATAIREFTDEAHNALSGLDSTALRKAITGSQYLEGQIDGPPRNFVQRHLAKYLRYELDPQANAIDPKALRRQALAAERANATTPLGRSEAVVAKVTDVARSAKGVKRGVMMNIAASGKAAEMLEVRKQYEARLGVALGEAISASAESSSPGMQNDFLLTLREHGEVWGHDAMGRSTSHADDEFQALVQDQLLQHEASALARFSQALLATRSSRPIENERLEALREALGDVLRLWPAHAELANALKGATFTGK